MRLLSRWWILVVVLAGIGIVGGCSGKREVTGQVFVVTKGGDNVKLGLVGMHVVEERRMSEIATRLLAGTMTRKANAKLLMELATELEQLTKEVPSGFEPPLEELATAVAHREVLERSVDQPLRESLFKELPAAVTKTDADGTFTVEVSGAEWLAARGQRRAGDSTEEYFWLLPLKGAQKKLLISNDRMLEDDDALVLALIEVLSQPLAMKPDESLANWANEQRASAKKLFSDAKAKVEAAKKERLRLEAEAKSKADVAKDRMASGGAFQPGEKHVLGLAVRWVPAGGFTMGSPNSEEDRSSDEAQHEVVLSRGFFIAETECTQAQWELVMGNNPSNFKGPNRPVERVSWEEAVEYCRKLTTKQHGEGLLPVGWEWRLPTESEWEYGARAGQKGLRHGELEAIAWWSGNSGSETHAVGGKQPNALGLYDMMGNVSEWCADWSGDYPTGTVTDPSGPSSGSYRVFRGSCWRAAAGDVRSALRRWYGPGDRTFEVGFRPVLSSVR